MRQAPCPTRSNEDSRGSDRGPPVCGSPAAYQEQAGGSHLTFRDVHYCHTFYGRGNGSSERDNPLAAVTCAAQVYLP